jgi:hypothetical protein
MEGEWRDRSRKHRYLMIFDKGLKETIDVERREVTRGVRNQHKGWKATSYLLMGNKLYDK